jgi:hypothetical protein
MIKTMNAFTTEIDDAGAAVGELLGQLDLGRSLRSHSVGILTCFRDFISGGVVKALCDALPFDVAGCGCIGSALPGASGELLLALTVFTSDDVVFSTGLSGPLSDGGNPFSGACAKAVSALPAAPSLMLAYAPHMTRMSNDRTLSLLSEAAPGVPVFGTIASSFEFNTYTTPIIYNGGIYEDRAGFIALAGNVHPEFFVAALADKNTQKSKAVVTKTDGTKVFEINNKLPSLWLREAGIDDASFSTLASFPFIIDYKDGMPPVPRAFFMTSADGCLTSSQYIRAGNGISLGELDYDDVMATSSALVREIVSGGGERSVVLMHSCLSRLFVLGIDTTAELELVRGLVGDKLPFHLCYSGGEICPIRKDNGELLNRLHNFSLVACVL